MIREATPEDEPALRALDRRVWSWRHAPVEPRDRPFDTDGTLVYVVDGEIAGYVKMAALWDIPSVSHVRELKGLAVDERFQRRGIGRQLLEAIAEKARAEGARKVLLRALGHNQPALALYAACGWTVEGVLHDLFFIEGAYVDDVLMSLDLEEPRGGAV